MLDASMYYAQKSSEKRTLSPGTFDGDYILCTLHRAENTDDPVRLRNIVEALNEIHMHTRVVLPLHPRTKKLLEKNGLNLNVNLLDPVGYFDMIELLKHCNLVMTDSGGLQKEAYFFKNNCVTLRDETEWVELVQNGFNVLAGADKEKIIASVNSMLTNSSDFSMDLYGDGHAGEKIVDALLEN